MKRFRFVGDAKKYLWDDPPVYGKIYNGDYRWKCSGFGKTGEPLETWVDNPDESGEWEELQETNVDPPYFEPEEVQIHNRVIHSKSNKIPNQDKPASEMTKFEMAVFMYLPHASNTETAIERVREAFKQLENEKHI